jgi:hypothetical protein
METLVKSAYLDNFSQCYKDGVKSYLSRDLKNLKKSIQRCTDASEKKLLFIRELILEQNSEEALQVAQNISEYFPHIKAEKHLQLASIHSISSQHEKAIASNMRALEYFRSVNERTRIYAILYNLSVDASLLRLRELSNDFLDQAQEIASGPEELLEIARSKACNYSQDGNFSKALSILEKIKDDIHQAPRLEAATFCMVAADICVRANKLELAQNYLSKVSMKKNYSYFERAQIQKKLLEFLTSKKASLRPQKLYPIHKSNEYLLQWNTLIHIQNGELQEAQKTWAELSKLRPRIYASFLKTVDPLESLSLFFSLP